MDQWSWLQDLPNRESTRSNWFQAKQKKHFDNFYDKNIDFSKVSKIKIRENTSWNYSYYPIIFKTEKKLLETLTTLNEKNI